MLRAILVLNRIFKLSITHHKFEFRNVAIVIWCKFVSTLARGDGR